jgi:hypothetical protein
MGHDTMHILRTSGCGSGFSPPQQCCLDNVAPAIAGCDGVQRHYTYMCVLVVHIRGPECMMGACSSTRSIGELTRLPCMRHVMLRKHPESVGT